MHGVRLTFVPLEMRANFMNDLMQLSSINSKVLSTRFL